VNSAAEYSRALEHLHAHPEERARLGANAAEFARRHWGATNAARSFDGLMGRLLSQPKRVRSWPASSSSEHGLDREFAIHPAARMFVESLGEAGEVFRQSMRGGSAEETFAADAQIGRMPRSIYYVCGVRYRNVFPNDPYLNLWTGLACFETGRHQEAVTCFDLARRNGLGHWRAQWYYALAAEKCGKLAEAHAALDALLRVMPEFSPAAEMKGRLPRVPAAPLQPAPTLAAQQHVNQAQQLLKAGKLSAARESLARALELIPGQILLMELLADLDCRMGNRDAARELCEAILKREPGRATSRMLSIQKQVMLQPR
jgi:tetratricopeptide (TPR) repeat protein